MTTYSKILKHILREDDNATDIGMTDADSDAMKNLINDKMKQKQSNQTPDEDTSATPDSDGNPVSSDTTDQNESRFLNIVNGTDLTEATVSNAVANSTPGTKAVSTIDHTPINADTTTVVNPRDAAMNDADATMNSHYTGEGIMGNPHASVGPKMVGKPAIKTTPVNTTVHTQHTNNTVKTTTNTNNTTKPSSEPSQHEDQLVRDLKPYINSIKAAAGNVKNGLGKFAANNPDIAKIGGGAAAALALYYAWNRWRRGGQRESVEPSFIAPMLDESFKLIDYITTTDKPQKLSAITEQLSNNAKIVIAMAMKDKEMPIELKKEFVDEAAVLFDEDIFKSLQNIATTGKTNITNAFNDNKDTVANAFNAGKGAVVDAANAVNAYGATPIAGAAGVSTLGAPTIAGLGAAGLGSAGLTYATGKKIMDARDALTNAESLDKLSKAKLYAAQQYMQTKNAERLNAQRQADATNAVNNNNITSKTIMDSGHTAPTAPANGGIVPEDDAAKADQAAGIKGVTYGQAPGALQKVKNAIGADMDQFKQSPFFIKAAQYVDRVKQMAQNNPQASALAGGAIAALAAYVIWRAYKKWKANKGSNVQEIKADMVSMFGFDPIAETKSYVRRIENLENSPERTVALAEFFNRSILNENKAYKDKICYGMKKCLTENEMPRSIQYRFIKFIQEADTPDTTTAPADTPANTTTQPTDVNSNVTAFKNFANAGNQALDQIQKSDAPEGIKAAASKIQNNIENAAQDLKNKVDKTANNTDTLATNKPQTSTEPQQTNQPQDTNTMINNATDTVQSIRSSGKNMNQVWANAQNAIPEIKGKQFNQVVSDFRANRLSSDVMGKVIQNLNSQK